MSHAPSGGGEVSLKPSEGWHCSHLYYRFDRAALKQLTAAELAQGREHFAAALDPAGSQAPARLQTSLVSGHKADFAHDRRAAGLRADSTLAWRNFGCSSEGTRRAGFMLRHRNS